MLGGSYGRRWYFARQPPGRWGKRVRRPGLELEGSWPQPLSESPAHRRGRGGRVRRGDKARRQAEGKPQHAVANVRRRFQGWWVARKVPRRTERTGNVLGFANGSRPGRAGGQEAQGGGRATQLGLAGKQWFSSGLGASSPDGRGGGAAWNQECH